MLGKLVLDEPLFSDQRPNTFQDFWVTILFVLQEPRPLLGDGHVGCNQHAMMKGQVPKLRYLTTISRKGLRLQLLEVDILGFIDVEIVKRFRV